MNKLTLFTAKFLKNAILLVLLGALGYNVPIIVGYLLDHKMLGAVIFGLAFILIIGLFTILDISLSDKPKVDNQKDGEDTKELKENAFILGIGAKELQRQVEERDQLIEMLEGRVKNLAEYIAQLKALSHGLSIEDRIQDASNYEFTLRIMQKQLADQLIYLSDGDSSVCSTMQFTNMEQLCNIMLCSITMALQARPERKGD